MALRSPSEPAPEEVSAEEEQPTTEQPVIDEPLIESAEREREVAEPLQPSLRSDYHDGRRSRFFFRGF